MIPDSDVIDQWTVISDCITKPDESIQAIETLTTEMFTDRECRTLFEVFKALHADGLPTDINHVLERVEARGAVSRELSDRLHEAGCQVRAPRPVAYYAGRVREHYRKRCARELFYRQQNRIESGADVGDVLTELQADLMKLDVQGRRGTNPPTHGSEFRISGVSIARPS